MPREFGQDVVHGASPVLPGAPGITAAQRYRAAQDGYEHGSTA
jgi:hypothetical protein